MPVEISAHQAKPRRATASSNSLLADYYFWRLGFLTNQWPPEEDCPNGAIFLPMASRAPNQLHQPFADAHSTALTRRRCPKRYGAYVRHQFPKVTAPIGP
jgi:hypothetical protein